MNINLRKKFLKQKQEKVLKTIADNDEFIRLFELEQKELFLQFVEINNELVKLKNK